MRFSQALVWACQGILVLILVQFKAFSFALDINLNQHQTPERTILRENNSVSTDTKTMAKKELKGDTKLYLGHGIYLYKVNETNSTTRKNEWEVKDVDIPKLFRLSFPAADPNDPQTTSNSGNKNTNKSSTIGGIHPWILGLACFVGCLLVMVVITVAILARRWMMSTFHIRRTRHNNMDNDLDNLVVEADLDGPKFVASNLSPLPPRVNNNSLSAIIAPSIMTHQQANREPPSMFGQNISPYNVERSMIMSASNTSRSQFCDNFLPALNNSHTAFNSLHFNTENEFEEDVEDNNIDVSPSNGQNITQYDDVDFLPSFVSTSSQLDNIYGLNNDDIFECRATYNVEYSPPIAYNDNSNNDNLAEYTEQLVFEREIRHQKNLNDPSYNKNRQYIGCDEFHEHSNYSSKQTNDIASRPKQQNIDSCFAKEDFPPPKYEICDTVAIFSNADFPLQRNHHASNNNSSCRQLFTNDVCAKMVEFLPSEEQSCRLTGTSSPPLSRIAEIACYVDDSALGGVSKNMISDVNVTLNDSASCMSNPSSLLT